MIAIADKNWVKELLNKSFKKAAQSGLISGGTVTLDDTVTETSENGVKSSGIYSAIEDAKDDVKSEILGAAPETLDTLQEIADALGNDNNLATTLTNEIGKKADSASVYTKTEVDNKVQKNKETLDKLSTSTAGVLLFDGKDITVNSAPKFQFSTMPTAGATYLNKVVQYTGNTTSTFSQGCFYLCKYVSKTTTTTDGSYTFTNPTNNPITMTIISFVDKNGTGGTLKIYVDGELHDELHPYQATNKTYTLNCKTVRYTGAEFPRTISVKFEAQYYEWVKVETYQMPTATTSTLGAVKVDGTTIKINNGVISGTNQYTLPKATTTTLGGVKPDGTTITVNSDGVISGAQTYSLPKATASTLGGIKVGNNLTVDSNGVLSANDSLIEQHNSLFVGYENYSEDEIIVGKHTNGKPLYRKVVSGTTASDANTTSNIVAHGISNMEEVVNYYGTIQQDEYTTFPITVYANSALGAWTIINKTYIRGSYASNLTNKSIKVVIEYTKTTDKENSFRPSMIETDPFIDEVNQSDVADILSVLGGN